MSTLMKLSATNPIAKRVMDAYNPDQERDERGRWGSGGPGSGAETQSEHAASSKYHTAVAVEHGKRGEAEASRAHALAAAAHKKASETLPTASGFGIPGGKAARNASRLANEATSKSDKVGTERTTPFGGRPGQFPGLERANTTPWSFKQQERPERPSESVVLLREEKR